MYWLLILGTAGVLLIGVTAGAMAVRGRRRPVPVAPGHGYPGGPDRGDGPDVAEIVETMWDLGVSGADDAVQFLNQMDGAGLTAAQTGAVLKALANRADPHR